MTEMCISSCMLTNFFKKNLATQGIQLHPKSFESDNPNKIRYFS